MEDRFVEIIVKKQPGVREKLIRVLLILATVLSLAATLLHPYLLAGFFIMGAVDYLVMPRLSIEYEYSYVNGEMEVDKIFSKKSRKRAAEYHFKEMEILAPKRSHRLDSYRSGGNLTVRDFSSGAPGRETAVYGFVISSQGRRELVYFEPDDRMLRDIRTRNASRVFLD